MKQEFELPTREELTEFQSHPVWRAIKKLFVMSREQLIGKLINMPEEKQSERVETRMKIKLLTELLDRPHDFLEELQEQEEEK